MRHSSVESKISFIKPLHFYDKEMFLKKSNTTFKTLIINYIINL